MRHLSPRRRVGAVCACAAAVIPALVVAHPHDSSSGTGMAAGLLAGVAFGVALLAVLRPRLRC